VYPASAFRFCSRIDPQPPPAAFFISGEYIMLIFGSGNLYGTSSAANSTPRKLGSLQDVSFDFSFDLKQMYGQNNFAVDMRRGRGKISGKAKHSSLNGAAINDLFFNQSASTGLIQSAVNEADTVPSAAPYTVTVANSATWTTDLGVVYAASGLPLARVASAPAAGQYSVAAGVYTFASADAATAILVDYLYSATTGGTMIAINNQVMGTTPVFMGVFTANVGGKIATLQLYACTSSKLSLATKLDDYAIPEFDFDAMANAAGSIGMLSIAN
jgi:hypothetical protein